jgi:outer membrane receptor protein involved in Fe transport
MMTKHRKPKDLSTKRLVMKPLAVAIISALSASVAMAQESEAVMEQESLMLEEVIVTATKREVSMQEVPQSILAFSTREIQRRGILDMYDVVSSIPSLALIAEKPGVNYLVFRGIGTMLSSDLRVDSQVAVYLDDQPMTSVMGQFDPRMVDIERIESLPGPQGTLFGSSSQSGTLRFITNKPNFSGFSGQVSAELKSTDGGEMGYDINGHLNIPVNENFAIRVVGFYAEDGGYIDNVLSPSPHGFGAVPDNAPFVEKDFNDFEIKGGRLSALWNISEKWNALTTLMYQESKSTGSWQTNSALGDYETAVFNNDSQTDEFWSAALTIRGDLGFAEFSNTLAYSDRKRQSQDDITGYEAYHTAWGRASSEYYYPGEYNYLDIYDTGYNGGSYGRSRPTERISNEVRLTSTSDSRLDWMVGAFYEEIDDGWFDSADTPDLETSKAWDYANYHGQELCDAGYDYVTCPMVPHISEWGTAWYTHDWDRSIDQIAVFGELGYDVTDKLHVVAGMRWFEYDRYTSSDYQFPPGFPITGAEDEGFISIQEGKDSNQAYKLSAQYQIDDDRMVYALFSQGFRLGGRNSERAIISGWAPEYFDSDLLNNYEIGLKSEWLDNRLQVNATLFYMDWDDIQMTIRDPCCWYLRAQVNGEGGQNTGAEIDFKWLATDNLSFNGNAYFGDPYYTDAYYDARDRLIMGKGTAMPFAPTRKYAFGVDYSIPDVFAGNDVYIRWDVSYRGGYFSDLGQANEGGAYDVESATTSNLQVGLEMDSWTMTLMVRNLTNEQANTDTSYEMADYGAFWGSSQYFGAYHSLARPRTISFRVIKRF